ncbi:hypothetical protein ABT133_31175 [Streptomyces sp. NPDC001835]|uniref:hypothetical protein n=1 Tax=Streptomyces sp. NPDC001835 TaxID=3154528 RepID=UPI003333C67A
MFFAALHSPASVLALAGVLFFVPPALSWWKGALRSTSGWVRALVRARAAWLRLRVRVWLLTGHPGSSDEDGYEGR